MLNEMSRKNDIGVTKPRRSNMLVSFQEIKYWRYFYRIRFATEDLPTLNVESSEESNDSGSICRKSSGISQMSSSSGLRLPDL